MNTTTARELNVRMQDLIERFAALFPQWPSLTQARESVRIAARKLDDIDAGRSPFGDNPQPAAQAISRPYSFVYYMTQTASATDPEVLQTLEFKRIPPPQTDVPATIANVAAQIARVESMRAAGTFVPLAAKPAPQTATPAATVNAQAVTAAAAPATSSVQYAAPQAAPAVSAVRSPVESFAPAANSFVATSPNPQQQAQPATAPRSVPKAAIAAGVGVAVLVAALAFGGKRKGGKR